MRDRRGSGSGDSYKVLLIDDARHTEKLGTQILLFSRNNLANLYCCNLQVCKLNNLACIANAVNAT
jgi:hypothetical protein